MECTKAVYRVYFQLNFKVVCVLTSIITRRKNEMNNKFIDLMNFGTRLGNNCKIDCTLLTGIR